MTLKEKIQAIYQRIDHVEKAGHNKLQNYDYVRAADVVHAVRREFADLGIIAEIDMNFVGAPYTVAREKAPNAPFTAVNVKCDITLHDVESDEKIHATGLGTGCDSNDKASYKAQTGALKYALRHAGLVPDTEGDPEADESVDEQPDFQSARRSRPEPEFIPDEPRQNPRQQAAPKAEVNRPAAQTSAPTSAPVADTQSKPTSVASVPAAEPSSPTSEPTKTTNSTGTKSSVSQTVTVSDKLPTEGEMEAFRSRFTKLGDDLSTAGLKASRSMPLNRKVLAYMLDYLMIKDAKQATAGQWSQFFEHCDEIKQNQGLKHLAGKIEDFVNPK